MRILVLSVALALLLAPQAVGQADKPLDCSTGPITKMFGGTAVMASHSTCLQSLAIRHFRFISSCTLRRPEGGAS